MSAQAILSALVATPPGQGVAVDASVAPDGSQAPAAETFGGLIASFLGDDEAMLAQPGDIAADDPSDQSTVVPAMVQPTLLAPAPLVLLALDGSGPASESPPVEPTVDMESGVAAPDDAVVASMPLPTAPIADAAARPALVSPASTTTLQPEPKPSVTAKVAEPLVLPPADPVAPEPLVLPAEPPVAEGKPAPQTPLTLPPTPLAAPPKPLTDRTTQPSEPEPVSPKTKAPTAASVDDAAGISEAKGMADAAVKTAEPLIIPGREARKGDGEPTTLSAETMAPTSASTASAKELTTPTGLSRATIDATAQIAARIVRQLEGRSTRFEMALLPEELGRVDVKLDIDSEGRLAARLAFDNPAAATDLRGRADELRRQLEQQGFHIADDAFEFTQRDSGSHAFDRGQDQSGGRSRAFSSAVQLNADAELAVPARWAPLSLSPTGVDMKV